MATILLASINYWPEETGIGPYTTGLAEHLAAGGHDVTVLTGMPHYPAWKVDSAYRGRWRSTESRHGVRILRRAHFVPARQSAIRRALYEGTFLLNATLGRLKPQPDAVIGVTPSLSGGVVARLAGLRSRASYGVVVQDLMSEAAAQSGISGGRAVAGLTGLLERWAMSKATVVAPVADAFRPGLASLGVASERIHVLPNWSHLPPATKDRYEVRRSLGWDPTSWIVLHAGNMGLKQGLDQVLDAARSAGAAEDGIRFVLMGDGSQRASLETAAANLPNVEFRPFVAEDQLADVLAAADVLLLSERPTVVDMSLPSKLTSYFASGRPVVAAVHPDGASAHELARADGGVVTPAGDPEALVHAIIDLRRRPEEVERLAANGRRYAEEHLGQAAALRQADAIVERLIERTGAMRKSGRTG
jgi:colanic acid biosynthesis glycosyl transferase WcaI